MRTAAKIAEIRTRLIAIEMCLGIHADSEPPETLEEVDETLEKLEKWVCEIWKRLGALESRQPWIVKVLLRHDCQLKALEASEESSIPSPAGRAPPG